MKACVTSQVGDREWQCVTHNRDAQACAEEITYTDADRKHDEWRAAQDDAIEMRLGETREQTRAANDDRPAS